MYIYIYIYIYIYQANPSHQYYYCQLRELDLVCSNSLHAGTY